MIYFQNQLKKKVKKGTLFKNLLKTTELLKNYY